MSKLNIDQKTIFELLSRKEADFLIPDFQRPYAWEEEQCQILWDDIVSFALPNNKHEDFNTDEKYFLGSIVTYKNEKKQSEIIDGQQRLTTLLLLLRAFYDRFETVENENAKKIYQNIEKCIWKIDEFGEAVKETIRIDSEVATDNDKKDLIDILQTGNFNPDHKSRYVLNYQFFTEKITKLLDNFENFPYVPARILNNCVLLPIETESQDTALRIFSTLNDRGLPLSDADIFKAQFYKNSKDKEKFIREWKRLEEITNSIFKPNSGSAMDELFIRYMYFLRAKERETSSTTNALRKFYERDNYKYLKEEDTINTLNSLALFWEKIFKQDDKYFTTDVLKKLFVLHYAPNGMWQNIVSVYFLSNKYDKDDKDLLDNDKFSIFLDKIIAFIFCYAITNPGSNALRAPIYHEMVNIVNGENISFSNYKFAANTRDIFENYSFTNQKSITRSIITWYAYTFPKQELLKLNENFQLEHIYAKKRQEMGTELKVDCLDKLGNKILLERDINIRASDYHFEDKKKFYMGERKKNPTPSKISELTEKIVNYPDFREDELLRRNDEILNTFFDFLKKEDLMKS